MTHVEAATLRACYRKKRFRTESEALEWGRGAWTGFELRAYRCPNDAAESHWHLTKRPGVGATVRPEGPGHREGRA